MKAFELFFPLALFFSHCMAHVPQAYHPVFVWCAVHLITRCPTLILKTSGSRELQIAKVNAGNQSKTTKQQF